MAVSNDLERLSIRAKQAEDRAAAAKAQARDQLQQAVTEAREGWADALPHRAGRRTSGGAPRRRNPRRALPLRLTR